MRAIKDDDGVTVTAGCHVRFSYGIPPIAVRAEVVERDGKLFLLTPGHNPTSCRVDHLRRHVGNFWVDG